MRAAGCIAIAITIAIVGEKAKGKKAGATPAENEKKMGSEAQDKTKFTHRPGLQRVDGFHSQKK